MSSTSAAISGLKDRVKEKTAQAYMNPYIAGFGLGLVLLASFVIMGRGLGASGAFGSLLSVSMQKTAPAYTSENEFFSEYIGDGSFNPLKDWLVFEVIGVILGGFISGALAGRNKIKVEKGPNISIKGRLVYAFVGGTLMGIGAKFARGCTSGQALTGGALLNTGSWAFMLMVFAGAYAAAYFFRRQWR